jgi:hypothetical protein
MTSLLAELGRKLADRWLSAVVLPGLLFVVVLWCAGRTGHRHALALGRLSSGVEGWRHQVTSAPVRVVVLAVLALGAATGAALLANALSTVVGRVMTAPGPGWLIGRRQRQAAATLERYRPVRLTAAGDRLRLIGERVDAQYGLGIVLAWLRLRLLLPDPTRATVQTAHDGYRSALRTMAWGLLYVAVGLWWWPAALAGLVTLVVGHRRATSSAAALADLIEATVDIHQHQLAAALGVPLPHGRITPDEGLQINDILNKRA